MPIYTYRCENCGIQFDEHQSFNDPPLIRCPECSKNALRKVFQPVGIVFKGSGFYATDNRSPSGVGRSKEKKDKDSSSDSDTKKGAETINETESSTETKTEKKTTKNE